MSEFVGRGNRKTWEGEGLYKGKEQEVVGGAVGSGDLQAERGRKKERKGLVGLYGEGGQESGISGRGWAGGGVSEGVGWREEPKAV